jgi:hypothetical protein
MEGFHPLSEAALVVLGTAHLGAARFEKAT